MSELKPCHNDLPDRLRWWAAHCDMTSCGCRISSLMMQAADTIERCDQPNHIGDTNKMIADNAPLTLEEMRGMDGDKIKIHYIGHCEGFCEAVIAPYYGDKEQYIQCYNGMLQACDLPLKYYGIEWTATAYRRKPEPEGGEG